MEVKPASMPSGFPEPETQTDAVLGEVIMKYQAEQVRRSLLTQIPLSIADEARAFLSSGGDPQVLIDVINNAATASEVTP